MEALGLGSDSEPRAVASASPRSSRRRDPGAFLLRGRLLVGVRQSLHRRRQVIRPWQVTVGGDRSGSARQPKLQHASSDTHGVSVSQPRHIHPLAVVVGAVGAAEIPQEDHLAAKQLDDGMPARGLQI